MSNVAAAILERNGEHSAKVWLELGIDEVPVEVVCDLSECS
jgi:hypothetical protein